MKAKATRPTYSRHSENATWHFWYLLSEELRTRLDAPAERAPWLAEQVPILLETLQDFAYPHRVVIETATSQEAYEQIRPITEAKLRRLDQFLRRTTDVTVISIDLTLCCLQIAEDGEVEPIELLYDGELCLRIEQKADGTLEDAPDAVGLLFYLWADIYAPISSVADDNRELAALNGPRLEGFLRRLQAALPLTLGEFEPSDKMKRGLVDRFGYKLPHEQREPAAPHAVSAADLGRNAGGPT